MTRRAVVLRRMLRLGLCSAGKKQSDRLAVLDTGVRMEDRATLLPGSCRTCSNSSSLGNVVRIPQVLKEKPGFPFLSKPQIAGIPEPLA